MEIYQNKNPENLPFEQWISVPGYEGFYEVSNLGRIKNLGIHRSHNSNPGIMAQCFNGDGYLIVCLTKCGRKKSEKVHRIVAMAFIENPENKPEVNHKYGNKIDNMSASLEWVTKSENIKHAYNNNLLVNWNKGKFGYENKKSISVSQFNLDGNLIRDFGSAREASRITGINGGNIRNVLRGFKKTAGGYIWKYKN